MYTGRAVSATTESKTIDELLLLDPALHKNASFVCQATIVEFDLTKGWWYKSCPSCHKVVKKNSESFECNEHGFINRLPEPCKKPRGDQTDTTNSARIAKEFHNLVVPKIEPAEKVPIATLRTKSQTKKTKDSAEDVHSQKKLTPQSP
ncbi:uncharacterized protein LOC125480539 [Pyrus x bretschneideri]|uniref:uncharacterized protein LOC125480539 n=1 Tax=Pyrus x bretschneideri TaxID=225117 RepID=UPI00202F391B|nr:uncharacterized protein LOC125480539 [Pyrus x bretschneideri]